MNLLLSAPRRLLSGRFAREVMTLQAGSIATMGVQFVVSVVIANLLGPASLGTYYLAKNVLDFVVMFANLAVGQALITRLATAHARKDSQESLGILAYFVKTAVAVALLELAIGLVFASQVGALASGSSDYGVLARVLFVSPLMGVFFNMVVLALQSSRQIARLTLLENGALIGTSLINVAVVALGGGLEGMLYSVALAPALTSIAAVVVYRSTLPRTPDFPSLGQIIRAAPDVPFRRYFAFSALVSLDKNFANLLAMAPMILLGHRATTVDAAYFRVAFNLMSPLSVPLAPIARNLYAKLAEVAAKGTSQELGHALLKVSLGSGAISVVSSVAMLVLAPFILMIYRPEFMGALPVVYVLGVRFALLGFGVGLGPIYQVLKEMELAIATKVIPAAVMFGGGWYLVGTFGAAGAAATLVIGYLVGDITNAVLVPYIVRKAASGSANSWNKRT